MNKLLLIIFGLIAFANAQGITNTLGGNSATDRFFIENQNRTKILTVTGDSKVGIGKTEPTSALDVFGGGIRARRNSNEWLEMLDNSSSGAFLTSHSREGNKKPLVIQSVHDGSGTPAGETSLLFQVGDEGAPTNVMMIKENGNVGIGTVNPKSKLSVGGDGNSYSTIYGEATGNDGQGVYGKASGSYGYGVYGLASGTNGQGVRGWGFQWDFYAANSSSGNYGSASSIRWKRNIVEIDNPLEKLAELRGVYFDWDEEHGGQHDVGCIAEEVGKVLPEIVIYEKNGIDADGMDYSKLTPLLIEVAKAQQKLIEELQVEIKILKSR